MVFKKRPCALDESSLSIGRVSLHPDTLPAKTMMPEIHYSGFDQRHEDICGI